MDLVLEHVLKYFTPNMLQVPSPVLGAPANWLLPIFLWVSLARSFVSHLRDPRLVWAAKHAWRLLLKLGRGVNNALAYPEPHPVREMFAELGSCIFAYLMGITLFVYGLAIALLSMYAYGQHEYKSAAIVLGTGLFTLLVARWFAASGAKARVSLERRWAEFPDKGLMSVAALSAAPLLCIAVALVANVVMPA